MLPAATERVCVCVPSVCVCVCVCVCVASMCVCARVPSAALQYLYFGTSICTLVLVKQASWVPGARGGG